MIDTRQGLNRDQRMVKALLSEQVRIDDRSIDQLLAYVKEYSTYLNYYNHNDEVDGNWDPFLEKDPIILMATIINESLKDLQITYEKIPTGNKMIPELNLKGIEAIYKWSVKIDQWYNDLLEMQEEKLATKIGNIITDFLAYQLEGLIQFGKQNFPGKATQNISIESLGLSTIWKTPEQETKAESVDRVMHNYRKIIMHIQEFTKQYLNQHFYLRSDHTANNALTIAFSILFKNIQTAINSLSRRHLDFYYKDVLQQAPKNGEPVSGFVSFELLPNLPFSLIPKGTILSAGSRKDGKGELIFETSKPVVAYPVTIQSLSTLHLDKPELLNYGTNEPIVFNIYRDTHLENGKHPETKSKKPWPVFGSGFFSGPEKREPDLVDLGFNIGSPVLFLSEGQRNIDITIQLSDNESGNSVWDMLQDVANHYNITLNQAFYNLFSDGFNISASTKKGWQSLLAYEITFNQSSNNFSFNLEIHQDFPAIQTLSKDGANTSQWPQIRFILNPYASTYLFSFLKNIKIESITIDVQVIGLKQLSVYNNLGKVQPGKTFATFGPVAQVDSYLMLGSAELFKKQLTDLSVELTWQNIPKDLGGFHSYYQGYSSDFNNDVFQIRPTILLENEWQEITPQITHSLFQSTPCLSPEGYQTESLNKKTVLDFPDIAMLEFEPDYRLSNPLQFDLETQSGFIKLELKSPPYGFGQEQFQKAYTKIATYNARKKANLALPNKPYTPYTSAISVNYKASDTLILDPLAAKNSDAANAGEYSQITAYGNKKIFSKEKISSQNMLYQYNQRSYLYIGLKGVNPPTTLNLLFHFTSDTKNLSLDNEPLVWEYLSADEWVSLVNNEIVADGTSNFQRTGIVEITLPATSANQGIEFSSELYWLRISTQNDPSSYPSLSGIYLNAIEVKCTSDDVLDMGEPVQAGSIKKAAGKLPDIKRIIQPAATFGGVLPEDTQDYYTRVSERTRHKNRALTAWDYESLLLERFNSISVAKCTNLDENFEVVPGEVTVVVLKKGSNGNEIEYFNRDELNEMLDFLLQYANPFAHITVRNPKVELLLATIDVKFKDGDNGGYYVNLLNQSLIDYFSPWISKSAQLTGIGGQIDSTMVLGFIENLPYVEYAQNLLIEHIVEKEGNTFSLGYGTSSKELITATPWSIFTSVAHHRIRTIQDESTLSPSQVGIGDLAVGMDFILENEVMDTAATKKANKENKETNVLLVFDNKAVNNES